MWGLILVAVGLTVAIVASRYAVDEVGGLLAGTSIPPFLVGITLIALGTDLPEIANSIAASISDHGDLNVGDSIGSTVVQITLVLAIVAVAAGHAVEVDRARIITVGVMTVLALLLGAALMADGRLGRLDGAILVGAYVLGSYIVWRRSPAEQLELPLERRPRMAAAVVLVLISLLVVGIGAIVAVQGFVQVADALGVSEFAISFFAASIGTSMPELVVDLTAMRKGHRQLALGGLFGASLTDSTLSIGIGPLVAPTDITGHLAVRAALGAAAVVTLVVVIVTSRERLDWRSAIALLVLYGVFYPLLLAD